MAAILLTVLDVIGDKSITEVTLTAPPNNFAYTKGRGHVLRLRNATAGALVPLITGSLALNKPVVGVQQAFPYAAGYTVPFMAAGAVRDIQLDKISEYLLGVVNVTNALGIIATLVEAQP